MPTKLFTRITNLIIVGSEMVEDELGFSRRLININLEHISFKIIIDREYARTLLNENEKYTTIETGTIEATSNIECTPEQLIEKTTALCELLSFSTDSQISICSVKREGDEHWNHRATIGKSNRFRPTFSNGPEIAQFIQQCFESYIEFKITRKLNIATDYLVIATTLNSAIETNLITLFILLEHLKHTWAQQNNQPYIRNYFREHGSTQQNPGAKLTFKTLLDRMFNQIDMPETSEDIIKLRNEILHSGLLTMNGGEKFALMERLISLLRTFFLKLLGYHGTYRDFTLGNFRTIT